MRVEEDSETNGESRSRSGLRGAEETSGLPEAKIWGLTRRCPADKMSIERWAIKGGNAVEICGSHRPNFLLSAHHLLHGCG